MWGKKHTEPELELPKTPNAFETAVLNIGTRTGGIVLQKDDEPMITFYKDYGTVEVDTLEKVYTFSLNNIESIEYDQGVCRVFYE